MTRTTCARTEKVIQLYLDDRLNRAQALELQRHLGDCAACREELSALLNVRHALIETDGELDLAPEGAPEDLADAIMRRIAVYEMRAR